MVTFVGHEGIDVEPPILFGPQQNVGGSHLLAPDVATAIPALWYSLHLPRDVFDIVDLPARALKFFGEVGNPVQVLFLPLTWLSEETITAGPFAACDRMRIYCPAADLEVARQLTRDLGFRLPPVDQSALNDAQLQRGWEALRAYWSGLGILPEDSTRSTGPLMPASERRFRRSEAISLARSEGFEPPTF